MSGVDKDTVEKVTTDWTSSFILRIIYQGLNHVIPYKDPVDMDHPSLVTGTPIFSYTE